jgi:hypothetical protein
MTLSPDPGVIYQAPEKRRNEYSEIIPSEVAHL